MMRFGDLFFWRKKKRQQERRRNVLYAALLIAIIVPVAVAGWYNAQRTETPTLQFTRKTQNLSELSEAALLLSEQSATAKTSRTYVEQYSSDLDKEAKSIAEEVAKNTKIDGSKRTAFADVAHKLRVELGILKLGPDINQAAQVRDNLQHITSDASALEEDE
jgi:uncharacterized protein HemX